MSDAGTSTAEGLVVTAPRKTLGEHGADLWRRIRRQRGTAEAVVAPAALADATRLEDAQAEPMVEDVEIVAKAQLTREAFADASVEEIVEFLKGVMVEDVEGVDETKTAKGVIGIYDIPLNDDEKAAVLRLRTGAPVAEGEEDTTAADIALLKAKFAIAPATVESAVADEAIEVDADADLTARTAELLALVDRYEIDPEDRVKLALLVGITEFSDELKRTIADMHSALKAQSETAPVADAVEGEAPVPLAFEERLQASFGALISALEARESEASAPADVEQAGALAVDAGGEHKEDDVVIVAAVEEGHGDDKRTD